MSISVVWVSDQVNLMVDVTWNVSAPSCVQVRSAVTKEGMCEIERRARRIAADTEEAKLRDLMLCCVCVCDGEGMWC